MENNNLVGSRKMIMALVILLISVGITLYKGDVPAGMANLLGVIFGGFVVGNAVEHVNSGMTDRSGPSAPSEPVKDPTIEAKLDTANESLTTVQQTLMAIIQKIWPENKG